MNHRMNFLAAVACVAVLTGCDWGGVSDDESWNDAYSWLNFSGTYMLSDAGMIGSYQNGGATAKGNVSGKVATGGGHQISSTIPAMGGEIGMGVIPNTVIITVSATDRPMDQRTFRDDGKGQMLDPTGKTGGSFSYASGGWSVRFEDIVGDAANVTIAYSYSGGSSGTDTGVSITFLHVTQQGNKLTMRDSNGNEYSGRLTSASVPRDGFIREMEVRMAFEVQSATGIKIIGSFSGDWSGATSAETGVLSNRIISGTISNGSGHDDIHGIASSVPIKPPSYGPSNGGANGAN